jgi:hypothetical protein
MVYISINTDDKQSKSFLEFAKTLPFVEVHEEPNAITSKALKEAKQGKATKHKNAKELVSLLNILNKFRFATFYFCNSL